MWLTDSKILLLVILEVLLLHYLLDLALENTLDLIILIFNNF